MPYWVYSPETIPNPEMFGKPGYTPEWMVWHGIQLPILTKGEWLKLPDVFRTSRHRDWRDRAGTAEIVETESIMKAIHARWGNRGIVVLDHEPTKEEKETIAARSDKLNQAFRVTQINFYEREAKRAEARQGEYYPSPYVDECYEILGVLRPYSPEALRAQRQPGEAVADRLADVLLTALDQRKAKERASKGD